MESVIKAPVPTLGSELTTSSTIFRQISIGKLVPSLLARRMSDLWWRILKAELELRREEMWLHWGLLATCEVVYCSTIFSCLSFERIAVWWFILEILYSVAGCLGSMSEIEWTFEIEVRSKRHESFKRQQWFTGGPGLRISIVRSITDIEKQTRLLMVLDMICLCNDTPRSDGICNYSKVRIVAGERRIVTDTNFLMYWWKSIKVAPSITDRVMEGTRLLSLA